MPRIPLLPLALALAALTACGAGPAEENAAGGGGDEAVATDPAATASANQAAPITANSGAPAAGNQSAAATGGLDRAFMVGRWTETDNCEETVDFRADGTMLLPWGEEARWELAGNALTMVGNPQAIRLRVTGPGTMEATKATGTVRQWRRC